MTTPAAVADRVAEILGDRWTATPGPWKASGHLEAERADTYSLDVDERGELCLWASLNPSGPIAVFREVHAIEEIEAVAEGIAEAIREHRATSGQGKGSCLNPKRAYN